MNWTGLVLEIVCVLMAAEVPRILCKPATAFGDSAEKSSPSSASQTVLNRSRRHLNSDHSRPIVLTSKTGFNLALGADGRVYGASTDFDPNTWLQLESVDRGVVRIKGIISGKYLAFTPQGRLVATHTRTHLTHFIEVLRPNHYSTYRSEAFRRNDWFVALNRRGKTVIYRHRQNNPHDNSSAKFLFISHTAPVA